MPIRVWKDTGGGGVEVGCLILHFSPFFTRSNPPSQTPVIAFSNIIFFPNPLLPCPNFAESCLLEAVQWRTLLMLPECNTFTLLKFQITAGIPFQDLTHISTASTLGRYYMQCFVLCENFCLYNPACFKN